MKSSALATALLVLATAGANAQSSVTVYGTVDLGLVPLGLDTAGLFERDAAPASESVLALATGFGALLVRSANCRPP